MSANLRKVPQSTGSGQNYKLVECDDTILVSVSLLEQRLNFCVRDNAIAVGVCLAEHDCERPETWRQSGVFCSQVALLLLRAFARHGHIVLPADTRALVEATHSRGCSPNTLFGLLSRACPRVF